MLEIKDNCYKGTRILIGNQKRDMIDKMISTLKKEGFKEIQIPIIQSKEIFKDKVGEENNNLMFNFTDRANRELTLAPEYTAIIQNLAITRFKFERNLKLFYVAECFRGEKPQAGRYRQFTQLGVEIINPGKDFTDYLIKLANELVIGSFTPLSTDNYSNLKKSLKTSKNASRGLDYYKEGKGFEIECADLGSSKQICGGGPYEGGIGFALGIDRILNIKTKNG